LAALAEWFGVQISEPIADSAGDQAESRGVALAGGDEVTTERPTGDLVAMTPGTTDRLSLRDHRDLTPTERKEVNDLIARLLVPGHSRTGTRERRAYDGRINLGGTVRQMLLDGGEILNLQFYDRAPTRLRVLMLIDVSQSMGAYSESLMRFAHAVVRSRPVRAEVFTFATRLNRITGGLRHPDPSVALATSGAVIQDWGGGTLLGGALKELLSCWGRGAAVRSTHCIIASDGWCGDPAVVKTQLPRLARLVRRLTWADPQAGIDGFVPSAQVTRDLRRHFSELLPCHSLEALRDLARCISVGDGTKPK
jgi:uncharacterized protein with von Willebrand factor type A (vWA) domain